MIKVTKEEAVLKIKEDEYVSVCWVTDGCPNCEYFEEILEELQEDLPNWKMYKVEVPFLSEDLVFEPSMYPTNFIFEKGVRKVVAVGVGIKEEVLTTFKNIEAGNFKTDEEIVQEQLDHLESIGVDIADVVME
jgi:thiol-disulfide isomerase/thioredoxin